jgi:non-ribosomal peptide synthase protein (TIGR01720 family)
MTEHEVDEAIAIVGMAGRFPGASDVDALWANLCAGVESLRSFSDAELRAAGADASDPGFVNAGGAMDGIEEFDAPFFGISRREAELTDPQHRILLETVWATLEHAGYDPGQSGRRIGIFGGVAENGYLRNNLLAHPELLARAGQVPILLASAREYAITRAAYKLGLTGPAVAVITACSTSAVAIHLAVQSLLAGECDLALAGAAYVNHPVRGGYIYQEDGILSADGHVRAFDADARGTVMASGVAFVALKPLAQAIDDGDTVYALIRGSAVNNDGSDRVAFTAPSLGGQRAVIEDALAVAGVDADTIGFVEAHGTGTALGDPIEIAALTQAYRRHTDRRQYCAIGSLKSNIGHLDAAAGVAGLIKVALSLYHERIPPSINFRTPNPQIDFDGSPFFVNAELLDWTRIDRPRRAGISAFGFGGTNAHIVLEEAPLPAPRPDPPATTPRVLTLSARSAEALERRAQLLADHLDSHPGIDLSDVAHTLAVGRARMPHRRAVVAHHAASAVALLRSADPRATVERMTAASGSGVAFLFTGQGAQYAGMGSSLYRSEPAFTAAIDECAGTIGDIDGHDLVDLLYGEGRDPAAATELLLQTGIGQPAIFTVQYALARLWADWGIEPAAMVGHSVGEIAAACVGGLFSLEDALRLAVVRGRLMQELPRGAMTAVMSDASVVLPLLDPETSLAAVNAPEQCVASGPPDSIDALERRLSAADVPFRRLATDRAFHSPMMEPAMAPLRDAVVSLQPGALRIPIVSTMTGAWATAAEIGQPEYWGQHARSTVRFADAVGLLLADRPDLVLLEVGPGETLASLVRQHPALSPESVVISTLPHRGSGGDDAVHARRALAGAWAAGVDVVWSGVHGGQRRRVPLPTYPFARERYWIDGRTGASAATSAGIAPPTPAVIPGAPPGSVTDVADGAGVAHARDRKALIAQRIISILVDLSGLDPSALEGDASFTDLGFDSLFLTQANAQFRKRFGVRVTLRQLLGETPTIDALAGHIDAALAPEVVLAPEAAPAEHEAQPGPPGVGLVDRVQAAMLAGADGPGTPDGVRWLIAEQLRLMEKQLDLMRASVAAADPATSTVVEPTATVVPPSAAGPVPVPMLPNVARYMTERESPHPEHWNLGVLLTPARRLDPGIAGRVVAALLERHDALRLRFFAEGAGWASAIAPATGPVPFGVTDLSGVAAAARPAAVERRAGEVQESLDLQQGPLIRVELFDLGEGGQRLLVVAHHFVMDQLSWPPFWEDFEAYYDGLERGVPVTLPAPATSFESWAHALKRHADSDALRAEMRAWLDLPWERVRPIPIDRPDGANTNDSAEQIQLVLAPEETSALLLQTPGVVRKADLILTALARATATWTGSDTVLFDMMGHGRDDGIVDGVDPFETVGFFVSYTPLVLRLPEAGTEPLPPSLPQQIDLLMRRWLGFDLLRYMASDGTVRQAFRDLPRAQILFNHHGQRDEPDEVPRSRMFREALEPIGHTHSPKGIRYYPLAVSSEIHRGQLRLNFVYSANLHERSTVARLIDEFRSQLTEAISRAAA